MQGPRRSRIDRRKGTLEVQFGIDGYGEVAGVSRHSAGEGQLDSGGGSDRITKLHQMLALMGRGAVRRVLDPQEIFRRNLATKRVFQIAIVILNDLPPIGSLGRLEEATVQLGRHRRDANKVVLTAALGGRERRAGWRWIDCQGNIKRKHGGDRRRYNLPHPVSCDFHCGEGEA